MGRTQIPSAVGSCFLASVLAACSSILFYPSTAHVRTPAQLGLSYQDVRLRTSDAVSLHGWFLDAQREARGTVFFLHGNAENISTHIRSVAWLPSEGYQVLLLDYRGYGLSAGTPTLPAVFEDLDTAFRWLIEQPQVRNKPIFVLGQSLGANLAAYYLGEDDEARRQIAGLVLDAPFASYRDLVRQKLAISWLTWPFQAVLSWLVPDRYSPIRNISAIAPIPLLVVASEIDPIVPIEHTRALFLAAPQPKTMHVYRGPHVSTFTQRENRDVLLEFLIRNREAKTHSLQ